MEKIEELIRIKLELMIKEYKNKILIMPDWQLNNLIPVEISLKRGDEKINYLIENYKSKNILYVLLEKDLKLVEKKNGNVIIEELKATNIDARFLEGLGLNDNKINEYFEFTEKIIKILS